MLAANLPALRGAEARAAAGRSDHEGVGPGVSGALLPLKLAAISFTVFC